MSYLGSYGPLIGSLWLLYWYNSNIDKAARKYVDECYKGVEKSLLGKPCPFKEPFQDSNTDEVNAYYDRDLNILF